MRDWYQRLHWTQWALLTGLGLVMLAEIDWKLLPIAALAAGLVALHFYSDLQRPFKRLLSAVLIAGTVVFSTLLGIRMVQNVQSPPTWDFLALWLDGQVGARGLNYYSPDSYQQVAVELKLDPDPEFQGEIIDAGFRYPPMTMWVLLPLGWLPTQPALVVWYIFQMVAMLGIVTLIWRQFRLRAGSAPGWIQWGVALMFLLSMQSTRSTIGLGQTMFLVTLCFILFWQERTHWRGGVWLAVGIMVKPFLAIILLYLLLRKSWAALTGTVIAGMVILVITLVGLGPTQVVTYLISNPVARLPSKLYTEWTNQSLLAGVLRVVGAEPSIETNMMHPLFLLVAIAFTLATIVIGLRRQQVSDEIALSLVTCLTLLLYPAVLDIYALILLPPLLVLWTKRDSFIGKTWTAVGIIVAFNYLLVTQPLLAVLFLWFVLFWLASGQPLPAVFWLRRLRLLPVRM